MGSSPEELAYLNAIRAEITRKMDWVDAKDVTHSQYIELSHQIKSASGTRLSPGTLKRIFGKSQTASGYVPQIATRNALATFMGHASWDAYKEQKPLPTSPAPAPQPETDNLSSPPTLPIKKLGAITAVVSLIAFLIWGMMSEDEGIRLQMEGRKLVGSAFHTTHFDYTLEGIDSLKIYFGDESAAYIFPQNSTITHYYKMPGVYHPKVMHKEQVLFDTTVVIATDGWEGFAHKGNRYYNHIARLYPLALSDTGSLFSPSMRSIERLGLDTTKLFWTHLLRVDTTGGATEFDFSANLSNHHEIVASRCHHAVLHLFGRKETIRLYFVREGCERWIELKIGNQFMTGERHDLSAFAIDLTEWKRIEVRNTAKRLDVFCDGERLFSSSTPVQIGHVLGVGFTFSGVGEVKGVGGK